MFHQSQLAQQEFEWVNLLSYPYYLFRLDHVFFGTFFFANIFLLFRLRNKSFPFLLPFFHMLIYSFAAEKGARYVCVVLPFIVMATTAAILYFYSSYNNRIFRWGLAGLVTIMAMALLVKSSKLAFSSSDYRTVMEDLTTKNANVRVIASQNFILNLYTAKRDQVAVLPYHFRDFLEFFAAGHRYLVIDPQAYVSYTDQLIRFSPRLHSYLDVIVKNVKPIKIYDNLSDVLLERFVFDHNENLMQSIRFLRENDGFYNKIYIYDVGQSLTTIDHLIGLKKIVNKLNPDYTPARDTDRYGR